jgi:hypothetical protein
MGFGTSYATLPSTNGIVNATDGDWAILTVQDGARQPGLYVVNGIYIFYTAFPAIATPERAVFMAGQTVNQNNIAANTDLVFPNVLFNNRSLAYNTTTGILTLTAGLWES